MALVFKIYSRIIQNVVTPKKNVEGIRKLIPNIEIILDSGFFSLKNLRLFPDESYTIALAVSLLSIINLL